MVTGFNFLNLFSRLFATCRWSTFRPVVRDTNEERGWRARYCRSTARDGFDGASETKYWSGPSLGGRCVSCSMHISLFRTSAAQRARVVAGVRLVNVSPQAFFSGWVGGSLKGCRSALLLARAMATFVRTCVCGVVAGARDGPMFRLPVHVPAVNPPGAHGDRRAPARDTAGRYTNTGQPWKLFVVCWCHRVFSWKTREHGATRHCAELHSFATEDVDHEALWLALVNEVRVDCKIVFLLFHSDTGAPLQEECVFAVRVKPCLHFEFYQRDVRRWSRSVARKDEEEHQREDEEQQQRWEEDEEEEESKMRRTRRTWRSSSVRMRRRSTSVRMRRWSVCCRICTPK